MIILAAIIALVIALFQYYYKTRKRGRIAILLSFLRFTTLFGLLLLLVNPKFSKKVYSTEKANLILLTDNSSSVAPYQDDIESVLDAIRDDAKISERFEIRPYSFDRTLGNDSLTFAGGQTDITTALKTVQEAYSRSNAAIVMITDGNQTLGQDYGFYGKNQEMPIYPVAIGDTTRYEDLAITQVNANRYAFLKNKYPIEIFVSYFGSSDTRSRLVVLEDGKQVYRETLSLNGSDNVRVINALFDAGSVGLKNITVSIEALPDERNTANNLKEIAVEVIDEKTNVTLVSNWVHPDIAALKKAIESNGQRSVSIARPKADAKAWEDTDLFILYQPDHSFKAVYDYIDNSKTGVLTLAGSRTNWTFLNQVQSAFAKNSSQQSEAIGALLNEGFTLFDTKDFSVADLPPVTGSLGEIRLREQAEVLLGQRIKGVDVKQPLLAVFNGDVQKEAVFFGEDIWKWRMQSYRRDRNFKNFDDLIGKLVLLLTSNQSRERLTLEYEAIFSGSRDAKIQATYFDNTFVFDPEADLSLRLEGGTITGSMEIPMLLKGRYYEADLSNLKPGKYTFTVTEKGDGISKSGRFTILDFDVEKQFLSTDYPKMERLAQNTDGVLFYPSGVTALVDSLVSDQRFVPVQVSDQNIVSLIDFRMLLAIIVFSLAAEWFIRKYSGLT
ncbi:vWA domain-containing protein [Pseudozobellia thermophila]|uniref:VWA domain-containing protein n=1 Tax=Pseudozobellia thermophila TaxID=192903 RepID=UPI001FCD003F|nr:VWA domain-containing protein [Pseudozobellia thermophila]